MVQYVEAAQGKAGLAAAASAASRILEILTDDQRQENHRYHEYVFTVGCSMDDWILERRIRPSVRLFLLLE